MHGRLTGSLLLLNFDAAVVLRPVSVYIRSASGLAIAFSAYHAANIDKRSVRSQVRKCCSSRPKHDILTALA